LRWLVARFRGLDCWVNQALVLLWRKLSRQEATRVEDARRRNWIWEYFAEDIRALYFLRFLR